MLYGYKQNDRRKIILRHPFSILHSPWGIGKSTCVKAITREINSNGDLSALYVRLAPTSSPWQEDESPSSMTPSILKALENSGIAAFECFWLSYDPQNNPKVSPSVSHLPDACSI
jgi:hypothetical protein